MFDRDHDYWRARVGAWQAARARVDTFVQNWPSKETGEAVSGKHSMTASYGTPRVCTPAHQAFQVKDLMASIHADALRFAKIDKPTGNRRFDLFLERLTRLGIIVFHPLLLEVMSRNETNPQDADAFAEIFCGAQTRSYVRAHPANRRRCGRCHAAGRSAPACRTG